MYDWSSTPCGVGSRGQEAHVTEPEAETMARSGDPAIGAVIDGRWTLERLLGAGGAARVYAGRHRNGARAAVKVLADSGWSSSAELAHRLFREAYVANAVDHPAVPRVLDDGVDPRFGPFLVIELLDGVALADRLRGRRTLDVAATLVIARSVCEVLVRAHQMGIVHRDLKPANVYLCHDGSTKVLDFGIALWQAAGWDRLTVARGPLGTPAFMAPEQAIDSTSADARADIYALGAVMFRMLTGRLVFEGGLHDQLSLLAHAHAPALATVAPWIPAAVQRVVDRCLRRDPRERYPTAAELLRDLESAGRRRRPWVLLAGLATATVTFGVTYELARGDRGGSVVVQQAHAAVGNAPTPRASASPPSAGSIDPPTAASVASPTSASTPPPAAPAGSALVAPPVSPTQASPKGGAAPVAKPPVIKGVEDLDDPWGGPDAGG